MRVRFVPKSSDTQDDGFIELEDGADPDGDEPVYQVARSITLELKCSDININTGMSVVPEADPETDEDVTGDQESADARAQRRWIDCTGTIQRSRWGRHRLSILGKSLAHESISVSIIEGTAPRAYLGALNFEENLDHEATEEFRAEILIEVARFRQLVNDLRGVNTELNITIDIDQFRGFFATWSPSVSDGRVVKYLYDKKDISNPDDMPEDFKSILSKRVLEYSANHAPVEIVTSQRPTGTEVDASKFLDVVDNLDDDFDVGPRVASETESATIIRSLTAINRTLIRLYWVGIAIVVVGFLAAVI